MTVSIIQTIGSHFKDNQIVQSFGNFAGHVWKHIQNFPTYVQDPRIAYSSLIMINIMAFQVAKIATRCFQCFFPLSDEGSEGSQKAVEYVSMLMGFGITIGTTALFVTKSQLPLSPYIVAGISVSVIATCILLENYKN